MEKSRNEYAIRKHMPRYLEEFKKQFKGRKPCSWWNFTTWLSSFTMANAYNDGDVALIKELMDL